VQQPRQAGRSTATGIVAAVLGIVLFAWFVREAGAVEIWNKVRQVGWGLPIIIAIAGLRFGARAVAWSVCIEAPYALPVTEAFAGVVCGDAFGNLTPLGPIVGEPAKAAYVRRTVPLGPALTALAIENLIYTISVVAMIAAAMIALIFYFPLPAALVETSEILIGAIVGGLLIALLVLWRRPTLISSTLGKLIPSGSPMHTRVDAIRAIEEQIHGFAIRRRGAAITVAVAELVFHALGVLEVYVTWWMMMGTPPSVLIAFVLEGANRLVTVVFKIVPLRLGVDETSTGGFTQLLGYGIAPGATLAIIRKARVLFWILIGTTLLVRRGLSPSRILQAPELR
jgi:Lysylphosphatidylglycerol synthase TM region